MTAGAARVVAVLLLLAALLLAAPASAQVSTGVLGSVPAVVDQNKLTGVSDLDARLPGRRLTGRQAQAIADALPLIRAERRKFPGSYAGVFEKGTLRWQVSYYANEKPLKEIGQVLIDDASGRVNEAYVGYKVPWTMARGYPGAFGRKVNAPWIWIPLSVLFVLPFLDPRRPFRLLHLDLLVLVGFGISVAYFNDAQVDVSVPLIAPGLAYLLARMLWIGLRTRPATDRPAGGGLRLLVPVSWLAIGVVFLMGFRIGLNVTNSNVIDVGYAGVVGADKLLRGDAVYGTFPKDIEHGDTYGPVAYAAYVPFVTSLGWSGRWDDLPAAHGAAIAFDLLAVALLFLVGRRVRGPSLGWVLAYAWAAWPFSLYCLSCNANDALVAALVLLAVLGATSAPARGVALALAGLAKFGALALGPLFATHREDGRAGVPWRRAVVFSAAFALTAAVVVVPMIALGSSPAEIYDRTIAYQNARGAPFSLWGLYDLPALQHVWQAVAVLLAVAVAFVPRRRDAVGLCALAAAVTIALQLGLTYWFYLYLVWFFPLVMIALLGRFAAPGASRAASRLPSS